MSIEIKSFGIPCKEVDVALFEKELKEYLQHPESPSYCQDMKVYFIHNPLLKTALRTEIDLLLIILVANKHRNYLRVRPQNDPNQQWLYIKNLIIPIKFDLSYSEKYTEIHQASFDDEDETSVMVYEDYYNDDEIASFNPDEEILGLQTAAQNYLKEFLSDIGSITAAPIYWIKSPEHSYDFSKKHILTAPKFGWYELLAYLTYSQNKFYPSIWTWTSNDMAIYQDANDSIQRLIQTLEKENSVGKITKQKIDRIAKLLFNDKKIYESYIQEENSTQHEVFSLDNLSKKRKRTLPSRIQAQYHRGKNLILITGKAGSGKTSNLRLLYQQTLEDNPHSVYFLTYNRLLAYDMNLLLGHTKQQLLQKNPDLPLDKISVPKTIQQFIFQQLKNRHTITLLNQERFQDLENKLNNNIQVFSELLNQIPAHIIEQFKDMSFKNAIFTLREYFNHLNIENPLKEFIQIFCNLYLKQKRQPQSFSLKDCEIYLMQSFKTYQLKHLKKLLEQEMFLNDYDHYCRELLNEIRTPEQYLENHKLLDTPKFIDFVHKLPNSRHKPLTSHEDFINRFTKQNARSLNAFKKRFMFIDEGQDFTDLEKEIIFTLFKNNIIIATGGNEQLTRLTKACDWTTNLTGQKIPYFEIKQRNNSYRLKKKIIDLCNHIASLFHVNLDLISSAEEDNDQGSLIVRFGSYDVGNFKKDLSWLLEKGATEGLSPYESLLVMTASSAKELYHSSDYTLTESLKITESDNIVTEEAKKRVKIPNYFPKLEKDEIINGDCYLYRTEYSANLNLIKNQRAPQTQYRNLFFESCRGLEAWSTMCIYLDVFFDDKRLEDKAVDFRRFSEDLLLTEDERRDQYAATWVLMALTRALDTTYIHIKDKNSRLGKILWEYFQNNQQDFSSTYDTVPHIADENNLEEVPF